MHTNDLGDHIGMESCVDLETDTEQPPLDAGSVAQSKAAWGMSSRKSSMYGKKLKNFPPPLPIQSATVMKRYYTDDGRLLITEEKVESPKYHINAIRCDGRLTLQLVESNESIEPSFLEKEVVKENEIKKVVKRDGGDGGGDGKRFSYKVAAVRVAVPGSCLFVNRNQSLHAIRPVQI